MSLGKVMTLAAMLAGDADPEALNQEEFKLVQEELKTYSIEVETQQDLASVLGALDLGEGKKVDLSSLPMYASNGMVYSDAGGEVMNADQIQSIVEVLLTTPNFRFPGRNRDKSITRSISKVPADKLALCSEKYWEIIKGGRFSDIEKAQVMVAILNLYGKKSTVVAKRMLTGEGKMLTVDDISKKVPSLMSAIDGNMEEIEESKSKSRQLDEQSRQLDKKLSKLKKNNKELKKTADYMNKLVDYLIGKRSLSDRDVQKMVDYVDETLKKVGEYDKDRETIRKQVLIKKNK